MTVEVHRNGQPRREEPDAKKPPTPCLPMPVPMKVTYVMRRTSNGDHRRGGDADARDDARAMFMDRTKEAM